MTRKATPKANLTRQTRDLSDPVRRCIATGEIRKEEELLRFVVSPDGLLVLDIREKLPGRGIWISCSREDIELACKKGLFSRSAKRKIETPEGLADTVEAALASRCLNSLGLGRRSGLLKTGFAKVEASLRAGKAAVLLAANDGSEDGRKKLRWLATSLPIVELFSSTELSQALGQENSVHASLARGGLTDKFLVEVSKLAGFRNQDDEGERTGSE
ncbi:MAG: RNA-binding protein [Sneathiella sp.]|nr:RNA-binding protein [Sneathiella sp.]